MGVDGSESSQEALRWAVAEAKLHGQPRRGPDGLGLPRPAPRAPAEDHHFEPDYDEAAAREALAQYVADVVGS